MRNQVLLSSPVLPLVLLLGSAVPVAAQWMPAHLLTGRARAAAAYDSVRARIVLFGGEHQYANAVPLDATFERDAGTWFERTPAVSPPAGTGAMCFDSARRRCVLVVGGGTPQTWLWDGDVWARSTSVPTQGGAMAYDASRKRVVLFAVMDTWEWDGAQWSRSSPTVGPPQRLAPAMAYDAARQRIVLFGGHYGGPTGTSQLADTWEWDGAKWTSRTPLTSPPPRGRHAMAYDAVRQRIVLFGGYQEYRTGAVTLGDTWEWDGNNWLQANPATAPPATYDHTLTWDAGLNRTVLFGGSTGSLVLLSGSHTNPADTWEWDGTSWVRSAQTSPSPRGGCALADDIARQRVVLFGGETVTGALDDTWEWDGAAWTLRSPATAPPRRSRHAMAADIARQRVVMFGGYDGQNARADTWEWDGSNWFATTPATAPPARSLTGMAYDAARLRTILFGGNGTSVFGDTWAWDGANWLQRTPPTSPQARWGHAMAYDPIRQRVVLFGGTLKVGGNAGDTWEWDGTAWTQLVVPGPPAGAGYAMAWDTARARVVLFEPTTTWEWDGINWSKRTSSAGPSVFGGGFAMTGDSVRGRLVGFGSGPSLPTVLHFDGDTWLLGGGPSATSTAIGVGSAGSTGVPRFATNEAFLGNPALVFDLLDATPLAACAFCVSATSQPQTIGACTLYLQAPILPVLTATNASGFASIRLPVPNVIALKGQSAFAQAFVADPKGPALGLAFSTARQLVLGD